MKIPCSFQLLMAQNWVVRVRFMLYLPSWMRPTVYVYHYVSFNSEEEQMFEEKFKIQAFPQCNIFLAPMMQQYEDLLNQRMILDNCLKASVTSINNFPASLFEPFLYVFPLKNSMAQYMYENICASAIHA